MINNHRIWSQSFKHDFLMVPLQLLHCQFIAAFAIKVPPRRVVSDRSKKAVVLSITVYQNYMAIVEARVRLICLNLK